MTTGTFAFFDQSKNSLKPGSSLISADCREREEEKRSKDAVFNAHQISPLCQERQVKHPKTSHDCTN